MAIGHESLYRKALKQGVLICNRNRRVKYYSDTTLGMYIWKILHGITSEFQPMFVSEVQWTI